MYKLKLSPIKEIFYNKDSQWGVYSCDLLDNLTPELDVFVHPVYRSVTVSGNIPKLELFNTYTINCKEVDSKFGKQYEFYSLDVKKLTTSDEQFDFLYTQLTHTQVSEIKKVYKFPVDEIIKDTFDYKKVKGIGRKYYLKIRNKILDNYVFFSLLSELGKYGITYLQVKKLYDKYKDADIALRAVKNNPYVLLDLPQIGFKRCDKIALNMGVAEDDPRRIIACAEYFVNKESELGHTWSNKDSIQDKVEEYISKDIFIVKSLSDYISEGRNNLKVIDNKITTNIFYNTENKICLELIRINKNTSKIEINLNEFITKQEEKQGFIYEEKQKEAFDKILNNNLFILTGAAGTGKSSVVNGLLNMFDESNLSYTLMSPSAKAAKVLEKYTKREATTIHRGLGWTPEGFTYNNYCKLPHDIIVVDEVSMIGIHLFNHLLEAIGNNTKLILLGDPFQLPSLEPGSVLDNILQSNLFSNIQLTKVFRQAEKSGIIQIATKSRNGEYFTKTKQENTVCFGENKDTVLIPCKKEFTISKIQQVYKKLLNKDYNDDNIIVLVPTRVGNFGTIELNKLLQDINNPKDKSKNEIEFKTKNYTRIYREKDKVIHVKNNYKARWYELDAEGEFIETNNTGIFNGDIGRVHTIIKEDGEYNIFVDYGDKFIKYENGELEQLEHAWCLTAHKFQGSASRVVIIGLDERNYYMAKRNWLYTSITRSSELLILCATPSIINKAINDDEVIQKRTFLKDLLIQCNN